MTNVLYLHYITMVKRSKFKVMVGPAFWKMHFLASLTHYQYLESYWTGFYQSFSIGVFWNMDECVNFGGQKVKGQRVQHGHMTTKGPAGGGIQSST